MIILGEQRGRWLASNILPHEPAVRKWLHHHRPGNVEADDLIQEAYAVLAAMQDVNQILNPRAYFFSVVRSLVLKHLRRARIVSIDTSSDIERLHIQPDELTPERHAGASQELRRVGYLIATLPEKCRCAFVLCKVEGLDQGQIAQRMGISRSAVEKHIAKALRLLMQRFVEPPASAQVTTEKPEGEDINAELQRH